MNLSSVVRSSPVARRVVTLGLLLPALVGCGRNGTPQALEPVVFCFARQPPGFLAAMAVEKGFFADEGLQVTVVEHVSGKRAMASMLRGEGNMATSAKVPIVDQSFETRGFRIVAQISAGTSSACVVARRDAGIAVPSDLRGKRVATQRASQVHFLLHLFLGRHGMTDEEVTLSFLKAEELPGALARGDIDAFSMREPYTSQARELLGENAVVFEEPEISLRTELVVVSTALADGHPDTVRAVVRALLRAEGYVRERPAEAAAIWADRLGIDPARAEAVTREYEFAVTMDQALLVALEDEARWMLHGGLTDGEVMPDYLSFLYLDALAAEKQDAVTVIR